MSKRSERHEMLNRMSRAAYSSHVLRKAGADRWYLRRPDSTTYWAEVATLAGQRIVIVGDGPDLIFSGGGCTGEDQIRWAAGARLDYLASKVLPHELAHAWDEDVALADIRKAIGEYRRDGCRKTTRALIAALRAYKDDPYPGEQAFNEAMYENVPDAFDYRFGKVVASDLYYAHAAFRRLAELLDEAGGATSVAAGADGEEEAARG